MARDLLIQSIVETYDLPAEVKEKISRISIRRAKRLDTNDFEVLYDDVAFLVEKFASNHRRTFSLDKPLMHDSQNNFYDIIGMEDPNLNRLIEDETQPEEETSILDIMPLLEEKLDRTDMRILSHLFKCVKRGMKFKGSPLDILANVEEIRTNVSELARVYKTGGKVFVPKKPFLHIDFNPSLIKFGKRDYHGDPLTFYRRNIRIYAGMGRGKLSRFDPGLYSQLIYHSQLDEALARRTYRGYPSPLDYLKAHSEFDGLSRGQVQLKDCAVYAALRSWKQLDQVPKLKDMTKDK